MHVELKLLCDRLWLKSPGKLWVSFWTTVILLYNHYFYIHLLVQSCTHLNRNKTCPTFISIACYTFCNMHIHYGRAYKSLCAYIKWNHLILCSALLKSNAHAIERACLCLEPSDNDKPSRFFLCFFSWHRAKRVESQVTFVHVSTRMTVLYIISVALMRGDIESPLLSSNANERLVCTLHFLTVWIFFLLHLNASSFKYISVWYFLLE